MKTARQPHQWPTREEWAKDSLKGNAAQAGSQFHNWTGQYSSVYQYSGRRQDLGAFHSLNVPDSSRP
jgi:hypothetical protein